MKKILLMILNLSLLATLLGCGCNKIDNEKNNNHLIDDTKNVIDDKIYEGLEFVNVGVSNGIITTIVINNTGAIYEGSQFSMKIIDDEGNLIIELIDEVDTKIEIGTIKTIETTTNVDLSRATSIQYSILK